MKFSFFSRLVKAGLASFGAYWNTLRGEGEDISLGRNLSENLSSRVFDRTGNTQLSRDTTSNTQLSVKPYLPRRGT